jgi:type VI secretion system protein ImpL
LRKDGHDPAWLNEFDRYSGFRKQAVAYKIGLFKVIGQKIGSIAGSSGRAARHAAEKSDLKLKMAAGTGYRDYRDALMRIKPATESKQIAFQMTEQAFKDDPATSQAPFYLAHKALSGLIAGVGAGKDPDPAIVRFVSGPFDFLWTYTRRLSTAQLEGLWNEQVLAPTAGLSHRQAMPMLVGTDGLVWKFVRGSAAPFLNRNDQQGYYPKEVLGGTLLFGEQFYAFLNKGAKAYATAQLSRRNYNVGIAGLPTRANKDAAVQPHTVRLELQCGGTPQTLVNQNYPVSKTFYWSSESCGDVVLTIEAGDAVLSKRYLGPQAFPDFLREFRGGVRTFNASEFPGEKDTLRCLKIRFVQVAFRFTGNASVLQTVESMPAVLPGSIGSL